MEPERPDGQEVKTEAAERDANGQGGKAKATALVGKAVEQGMALRDRAKKEMEGYKDPQQTQLWKSIFRVSHERSDPRNRSLAVLSNVFLHLHPAKINRDAVRYQYTWGQGRIYVQLFHLVHVYGVVGTGRAHV